MFGVLILALSIICLAMLILITVHRDADDDWIAALALFDVESPKPSTQKCLKVVLTSATIVQQFKTNKSSLRSVLSDNELKCPEI